MVWPWPTTICTRIKTEHAVIDDIGDYCYITLLSPTITAKTKAQQSINIPMD